MAEIALHTLYKKYEDISLSNLSYCVVCLRTEEERRMVAPKAIRELRMITKRDGPEVNKKGKKSTINYDYLLKIVEEQSHYASTDVLTINIDVEVSEQTTAVINRSAPETDCSAPTQDTPALVPIERLLEKRTPVQPAPSDLESTCVLSNRQSIYLNTPPLAPNPYTKFGCYYANLLNDCSNIIDKELIRNNIGGVASKKRKSSVLSTDGDSIDLGDDDARPPPLNPSKVDWENKIPMDVIFFTEGQPPNNSIVEGQITQVRSLTNDEYAQGASDNVIDLC
ncbi:uncharacterized protein LOC113514054 isoform X2 [Galleria mellonella]|uniref:Uncharacterized protein LOC113514054 isoform X2 n=1 Tax=Galleria mellonella TaxID=7137 RepID=A0ABM3MB76_GALME|nr:uncharacterized protein LOC113514054 isoform X2 [Galleria mellonella]